MNVWPEDWVQQVKAYPYRVRVQLSRQEDGLWRAEAPDLPGCFVDAGTVREAIGQLQECIAMALDLHLEQGWSLPIPVAPAEPESEVRPLSYDRPTVLPIVLPIVIDEFKFKRFPAARQEAAKTHASRVREA